MCGYQLISLGMASSLFKTLIRSSNIPSTARSLCVVSSEVSNHTAKWMQDVGKKSPMELINEVPPIKVEGRIVACGGVNSTFHNHMIRKGITFFWLLTAILHLGTQLSSYALTGRSQLFASIVAYATFRSTTTRSLK